MRLNIDTRDDDEDARRDVYKTQHKHKTTLTSTNDDYIHIHTTAETTVI
jgi:hypothetical protein